MGVPPGGRTFRWPEGYLQALRGICLDENRKPLGLGSNLQRSSLGELIFSLGSAAHEPLSVAEPGTSYLKSRATAQGGDDPRERYTG